jgi:hypothetical protein
MSFLTKVELKQLQQLGIKVEGNYVRKKDIVAIYRSNSLRYDGKIFEIHTTKYKGGNKVNYIIIDGRPFEVDFPYSLVSIDRDVRDFSSTTIFELKNPNEKLRVLQKNELEDGGRGY